jgi:hypothetical protein
MEKTVAYCSGADVPLPFLLFVLIAHPGLSMTTTMTTTDSKQSRDFRSKAPQPYLPGKSAPASAPLASFAGSPASGLLRRPAPTAGRDPPAGEAPWPLCVSAVDPYIL